MIPDTLIGITGKRGLGLGNWMFDFKVKKCEAMNCEHIYLFSCGEKKASLMVTVTYTTMAVASLVDLEPQHNQALLGL